MSFWVSSALDCSACRRRCTRFQQCYWIQHPKIVWNNNVLVIYKMLDLATLLKMCTAPPANTALQSKAKLTQKDFIVHMLGWRTAILYTFIEESTKLKTPSEIKPPLLSGLSDDHDWYKAKIKATNKAMKNKAGSISPTEACNDFAILTIWRNLWLATAVYRCLSGVWFSNYLIFKIAPVDLHLIFEKWILKNEFRWTPIFCLFQAWIFQAAQAVKIKFEMD